MDSNNDQLRVALAEEIADLVMAISGKVLDSLIGRYVDDKHGTVNLHGVLAEVILCFHEHGMFNLIDIVALCRFLITESGNAIKGEEVYRSE